MKRKFLYVCLFILLAIIGHSYVIYRYVFDGVLFTGPNDGMEQMVPIQMYLFDNWRNGQFFYATDFGLGGDFFTDLAYYFSTNLIFIINVLVIIILKMFIPLATSDIMFWMNNALIISVIKSAIAMCATFAFVRYISINRYISMLAAFLFVISPLYFRFTVYWPFFSDIFIWLPLLLLAIERYLKQGKIGLFIVIAVISLINNFYFAYYQLLTGTFYFAIRLCFKHQQDIIPRFKAIITLSVASILALGCSLFFFFPAIQGYFNNRRVPFDGHVDLLEPFNQNTNIFYDNYLIVILFITIQALLSFKLYKHYYFRLFAIGTIVLIIASFFPFIDQVFNGFSAPQKRWHYLIAFSAAILIALYVKFFRTLSFKQYIFPSIIALGFIIACAWYYDDVVAWVWFTPIVSLIGFLILLISDARTRVTLTHGFLLSVAILGFLVSAVFIRNQIYFEDHVERASKYYVNASLFNTPLQRQLVSEMTHDKSEDERIDWRVNEQDNTPMYQHFKGLSIYSSIFDHSILDFYYDQLKINMQSESVSRYQSTNERQNINSLFSIKYLMRKDYQQNLPTYFKETKSEGQYHIFENKLNLPSVRVSNNTYNAQQLSEPIDREHAMLDGVILNNQGQPYQDKAQNLLDKVNVRYHGIKRHSDNQVYISKANSHVQIHIPQSLRQRYKDFYLTIKVKRGQPDSNYSININKYKNDRLFNNSTYRTGVDTQLYRTQPDANGDINVSLSPTGPYYLEIQRLHGEDYKKLKSAHDSHTNKGHYKDIKNGVKVKLTKHQSGIASINIPYREGMHAYVGNKKVKPFKVNYMMTGVPVDKDDYEITIKYRPKYWYTMICLSIVSMFISTVWIGRQKIKKKNL
ncbi:YfhO family protein [Staphylococcus caeli]|uniref:Membrane protein n=1 Tax=Staphylococcus caeli TaxID=2201815 RepID=A0A1D4PA86_9STAP|nr:YfhO family protein [Staphylococcus caeli]SCS95907.1 membrane protein [Staphylococcus caeli]SCT19857.1 membrane protein [Staphylococcus caeli]